MKTIQAALGSAQVELSIGELRLIQRLLADAPKNISAPGIDAQGIANLKVAVAKLCSNPILTQDRLP